MYTHMNTHSFQKKEEQLLDFNFFPKKFYSILKQTFCLLFVYSR